MDGIDHIVNGGVTVANAPTIPLLSRADRYVIKVGSRFIKVQVAGDEGRSGHPRAREDLVPGADSADTVTAGVEGDG